MATHRHTQDTPYSAVPPPPPSPPSISTLDLILICVTFVTIFPTFLLMRLVGITSATDSISDFVVQNFDVPNPVQSQYRLQFSLESSAQRRLKAALAAAASLLTTLIVPALRSSAVLGSPLYNWTLLATVVFCGRYFVDVIVRATAASLGPRLRQYERWCYYANGTIIGPLGSALHSTLILLTWRFLWLFTVVYPVTLYGAWVFGAWMTRCIIILFNSAVLVRWRANALFDRFEERILRVGFQFHIMYALIPSSGTDMSLLAPWRKKDDEIEIVQVAGDGSMVEICYKVEDHIRYLSRRKPTKQEVALVAMYIQVADYIKFEERILRVGFQFHIMYALIPSSGTDMSLLAPWRKKDDEIEIVQVAGDGSMVEICYKVEDHIRYLSRRKPTKQEVALVAMYIQGLSSLLPLELGDTVVDIVRFEQQISPDDGTQIDKNWLKERLKLNNEDARVLYGELCALVTSPDQVSFQTFNTWMSGAYKDNLALGQTLRDGDNLILNSDRMLIALLINMTFLFWLFLTQKTTTQVLSVIPFVYFAKSFIKELSSPQFKMLMG